MKEEVMIKLQEKLVGVLDLFSFENAKIACEYAVKQFMYMNLINCIISAVFTIIFSIILKFSYKCFMDNNKKDFYDRDIMPTIIFIIVGICWLTAIVYVVSTLIETLQWGFCPLVKIYELTK